MYFRSSCLIPSMHFLIFLFFFSLSVLSIIEGRVLMSQTIVFKLSISFLNSMGFALCILELCCKVGISVTLWITKSRTQLTNEHIYTYLCVCIYIYNI